MIFYSSVAMLRQQLRDCSRIHMIITNGGAAVNIIPDKTQLRVEIRHEDVKYFRELVDKVLGIAEYAAKAAGCTVDVEMFEPPIACMKNNKVLVELYKKHLHEHGITQYVENFKSGGCSDMGNVSQEMPAIHPSMAMVRPDSGQALRDRAHVPLRAVHGRGRRGHPRRAEAARRHKSRFQQRLILSLFPISRTEAAEFFRRLCSFMRTRRTTRFTRRI